ncbi:MAG TPA: carboxypeptidase regulatory-like domain-containing protein [Bryobacteraceae bacterium]|nr:carboxypeptidase regulatory-like domain-containing protein [Bryobacteraceae bacterium]
MRTIQGKLSTPSSICLLAFLLLSIPMLAQFETAEVLGTVHDPSGALLPKAAIVLTNEETSIESKTTSDDSGNYDFFNVKPGRYTITAELAGFQTFRTTGVRVDVGARQRVDIPMAVGAITQSIDVKGAAEVLETDSSQHGQVINTQQVVELPLNGRNYSDLALLSTNVHRSPLSVLFAANGTPREGSFNVNGMRSTFNNFLLDGIDNNAYSTSNQGYSSQVVQPSPDAIAEFQVITSNFSAEYGRVGGGVINTALRSGTNEFHGTAYDFIRNTDLNAVGFTFSPAVFQKPTLQRNQFGVTIGGPIIKNKLFFFADYEGFRQLQRYLNFDSIPDSTDRVGVLPNAVYDPVNHTVYPANTQIPVTAINPFALSVLSALPAQNGSGRSNNYEALLLVKDYSDKYDAKIDYHVNDKMSAFLRFSQRKDLQYYQPDIPGPAGGNGNGYIHAIQQQAAAGYTFSITPTSLLEARFGFDHVLAGKEPPYLGGPSMEQLYGISGLPTTPNLTGGLNSQSISGFSQLGRQTSNPQFQNPTSFDPKLNYSFIKGRHDIKIGYEFEAIRTEVLDINPLYGADTYGGQFSKPTCALLGQASNCTIPSDSTTYNLADFLFGLPSTIQLGNNLVTNLRQHINSLYVQDDWRVNSKLTLNIGLRWEYATPLWERDNLWSNFDPATDTLIRATNGSMYNRALVHPDYKDFGPRLGFAYSPESKTVIRGGYGISYAFENRPGSAQEGINAPLALFGLLNQSIPAGGSVPSTFLNTQNSFATNIDSPSNFNPIVSNIDYIPANTKWPYVQSWLFSVQRQLTGSTVLEVAYNGNHSLRLPILADYNQAVPNLPGQSLGVQARRPIQSFGAITWLDPAGSNDYNGLSTRLEHHFSRGLYFLDSFTWSKALGDSEQALEYYPGYYEANPQNIHDLSAEKGPSSFDIEFINVASVVYQIPFGKGRQYGASMNRALDAVLGGWELNSIVTTNSGPPIDVSYSPSAANDVTGLTNDYRGEAILRPNVTGSSISQTKGQMVNNYFAGYTFTTPPAYDPFGDTSRNSFRAPGLGQWDLAADKTFRVTERVSLQFRSEFFNITNHTNFGLPTAISTSSAFGTIRNTYPSRQIQFALKLLF